MQRELPFISMVSPTYDQLDQLVRCLRACGRLDHPRDRFEVIVVDDGGVMPLSAAPSMLISCEPASGSS
jgi:cellulose synthase/poly-beta-1,6-N-acetylglucosamine synthase-like glycosyltransferase